MPFVIFPSESVLIGLALAEYEQLHRLGKDDRIEDVLYRRVHPFVPDLTEEEETRLAKPPEGLGAVLWCGEENERERGIIRWPPGDPFLLAEEEPSAEEVSEYEQELIAFEQAKAKLDAWLDRQPSTETLIGFAQRNGDYFRVDLDSSRQSLLDHLIQHLTADDEVPRKRWNERQAMRERWGLVPKSKPHHRAPEEVRDKFKLLIEHNQLQETFALGIVLGHAFADCMAIDSVLRHVEDVFYKVPENYRAVGPDELPEASHADVSLERSWRKLVDELAADPLFSRLEIGSRGLLDRLRSGKYIFASGFFGLDDSEGILNAAFSARTGLSLILGYVLGALRPDDAAAINRDKQNPIPRDFPKDDPSQLLATAMLVRRWGQEIEAHCRLVWPETPLAAMPAQLQRAALQGPLYEQRFAKIARPLLTMYYDVSDGALARCRLRDEIHFLDAVPELRSLTRIILDERRHLIGGDVRELIQSGEGQNIEFKSSARWDMKLNKVNGEVEYEIVKTVASFLNSSGGTLLIGVSDDRKVFGLAHDYKTVKPTGQDAFERWLRTKLLEHYDKAMAEYILVDFARIGELDVCRVIARPAPRPCYVRDSKGLNQLWLRSGNSKTSLDGKQTVEYVQNHWG